MLHCFKRSISVLKINDNVKKVRMLKGQISRSVGNSVEEGHYEFTVVLHVWNFLEDTASKWGIVI